MSLLMSRFGLDWGGVYWIESKFGGETLSKGPTTVLTLQRFKNDVTWAVLNRHLNMDTACGC